MQFSTKQMDKRDETKHNDWCVNLSSDEDEYVFNWAYAQSKHTNSLYIQAHYKKAWGYIEHSRGYYVHTGKLCTDAITTS